MRWAIVLLFLLTSACEPGGGRLARWPSHRKDKDARIEDLEKRAQSLESRVAQLTVDLELARAQIAKLSTVPTAPPSSPLPAVAPSP